jgi:hypothetical protein
VSAGVKFAAGHPKKTTNSGSRRSSIINLEISERIENKTEQQNKYQNSIIVTNFYLFYKNNDFRMTLLLLCNLCFSTCKTAKVAIADGHTFLDSIDKKSAGNLNLYIFDAI